MTALGEAFRRAMEGQGKSRPADARPRSDAIPQFDLGEAPGWQIGSGAVGVPEAPARPATSPMMPSAGEAFAPGSGPMDVHPGPQSPAAGAVLAKASRVASFAEGPLAPGCDELAGLRAALMASGLEGMSAVILIAGAAPAYQVTAVAVGLAGELARDLVHNVLLVDADVKNPGAASMLQVDPEYDFADVLDGRADVAEAILHSEGDNLSAMVLRPDPLLGGSRVTAETLAGPIARDVLASIHEAFDYVVIDAGAIDNTAVPRVLAARSTCAVLVVSAGTPRDAARAGRSALESAGGHVVGAVLVGTGRSR